MVTGIKDIYENFRDIIQDQGSIRTYRLDKNGKDFTFRVLGAGVKVRKNVFPDDGK